MGDGPPSGLSGVFDTTWQSTATRSSRRGGCPDAAGTLVGWSAAVPRPEGCPGYRYKRCPHLSKNALLAQSVEHSHGKAGVVGSIPTEGSTKWSGIRPATSQTPGGVAQLVRASGS